MNPEELTFEQLREEMVKMGILEPRRSQDGLQQL